MPKVNYSTASRLRAFVQVFGNDVFSNDAWLHYIMEKLRQYLLRRNKKTMKSYVENKKIWISFDETTYVNGCNVCIIGTLEQCSIGKIFLLNSEVLEKTNHSTLAKVFKRFLSMLWSQEIIHNNVHLFLSDAASYMVKASKLILTFYFKMIHFTCLAYTLHSTAK